LKNEPGALGGAGAPAAATVRRAAHPEAKLRTPVPPAICRNSRRLIIILLFPPARNRSRAYILYKVGLATGTPLHKRIPRVPWAGSPAANRPLWPQSQLFMKQPGTHPFGGVC
jgi:hypothetical protein